MPVAELSASVKATALFTATLRPLKVTAPVKLFDTVPRAISEPVRLVVPVTVMAANCVMALGLVRARFPLMVLAARLMPPDELKLALPVVPAVLNATDPLAEV